MRTAMGAAALVPCFRNVLLNDLPRPIIALDTSDEAISLNDFIFPASFTLVLGNEEYGISDAALRLADILVEIPLFGVKNSLNVACAFAIAAPKSAGKGPRIRAPDLLRYLYVYLSGRLSLGVPAGLVFNFLKIIRFK